MGRNGNSAFDRIRCYRGAVRAGAAGHLTIVPDLQNLAGRAVTPGDPLLIQQFKQGDGVFAAEAGQTFKLSDSDLISPQAAQLGHDLIQPL